MEVSRRKIRKAQINRTGDRSAILPGVVTLCGSAFIDLFGSASHHRVLHRAIGAERTHGHSGFSDFSNHRFTVYGKARKMAIW